MGIEETTYVAFETGLLKFDTIQRNILSQYKKLQDLGYKTSWNSSFTLKDIMEDTIPHGVMPGVNSAATAWVYDNNIQYNVTSYQKSNRAKIYGSVLLEPEEFPAFVQQIEKFENDTGMKLHIKEDETREPISRY